MTKEGKWGEKKKPKKHILRCNEVGEINQLLGLMENVRKVHWLYMNNPFCLMKTPFVP